MCLHIGYQHNNRFQGINLVLHKTEEIVFRWANPSLTHKAEWYYWCWMWCKSRWGWVL